IIGKEDFGTAALVALVGTSVLLAGGARWWQLGLCGVPGMAGMGYIVWSGADRLGRLMSFNHRLGEPPGQGYHPVPSFLAIASGGWFGVGLGNGIQKYGYLPEDHSDFIFSVICEELGILGGIGVIGLYAVLIWHGRRAMKYSADEFGRLLALGVLLTVGLQAA